VERQEAVDYSGKWFVMAAVAMSIFLGTIDGSIVNVAQPTLVQVFQTDLAVVQWVTLAYLLVITTLLLSVGRLADIYGKKSLFVWGIVIFTVGSVLCGLSPTIGWLIALRVIQAIGAAMITALGAAITTSSFPPEERGRALGITGSVVSIGIIAGPALGGILLDTLSWHWIFFVNLPVGILGLLLAVRYIPHDTPQGGQRFDLAGAITLGVSLLALLLALTVGQELGFGSPLILALFVIWLILFVAFIMIELRRSQPMLDLRLFRNPLFAVNVATGFITFLAIAGPGLLMPFYLQNVLGYPTRSIGLLLGVVPIGLGIMAPLAGSLSDRFGSRPITLLGLLTLFAGYCAISTLGTSTSTLGYILRFIPIGLGMGIFQSPNNSAIMGSVPRSQLGVTSSLLSITRTLGQTVGLALVGALWAARVYTYSPESTNATTAPVGAQVSALRETMLAMIVLIVFAVMLSIWGLWRERRGARMAPMRADQALPDLRLREE
jgi:EmrB/QacA subfamily drug resistance transporter